MDRVCLQPPKSPVSILTKSMEVFGWSQVWMLWRSGQGAGSAQGLPAHAHRVHVDAVGVGPGVLEILLQALAQRVGDLVEADELLDPQHLRVVARRA